jgi:hypothetical protein
MADKIKHVDGYLYKYEQIMRERDEEERWKKTRHDRFKNIINSNSELKRNLIRAAYPKGGEVAFRLLDEYIDEEEFVDREGLEKLKHQDSFDQQRQRIKIIAEKFDAPKRVEIKELEMGLKSLLEFNDRNLKGEKIKLKHYVCKELAFIIKDL